MTVSRGPLDRGWRRCICVAGGPSLRIGNQIERIVEAQRDGWRVIVVNSSCFTIPSADVLFSTDAGFWNHYRAKVASEFKGEVWTGDIVCANRHKLHRVSLQYEVDRTSGLHAGLSTKPGVIRHHGNSGAHGLLLAHQFGMEMGILAGYDFQLTGGVRNDQTGLLEGGPIHHHGPHPATMAQSTASAFVVWAKRLAVAARDLARAGVRVVNSSPETALDCFERMPLDEALATLQ